MHPCDVVTVFNSNFNLRQIFKFKIALNLNLNKKLRQHHTGAYAVWSPLIQKFLVVKMGSVLK